MPQENQLNIVLRTRDGEQNTQILKCLNWTREERIKRSMRIAGIGAVCTFAALFLPIVHFVLVPLGIVITPILARKVYNEISSVPNQPFQCPKCSASIYCSQIDEELFCDNCRNVILVETFTAE